MNRGMLLQKIACSSRRIQEHLKKKFSHIPAEMESEDSDTDDNAPSVMVNGKTVPLTSVDDDVIAQMTPSEKETYIQVYQEYYSHMYD